MLFPLLLVSKGVLSAYPYENKVKMSQKAMQANYLFTTGNVHWMKGQVSSDDRSLPTSGGFAFERK